MGYIRVSTRMLKVEMQQAKTPVGGEQAQISTEQLCIGTSPFPCRGCSQLCLCAGVRE